MKKAILPLLCRLLLCGCVNTSEYEELQIENSNLQEQVSSLQDSINEKDQTVEELYIKISKVEKEKQELEKSNQDYQNQINDNLAKIDELENGPSRLLSDINNAFESKDYANVISFAETLHSKFNGSTEDTKGQSIAKQAQSELDKIEAERKAEEERKAAEAAKSKEQKVHEVIRIGGTNIEDINSADGVSVGIYWRNESNKDIKYLYFTVIPYNAVGDQVYSQIGSKSSARCKITGPLKPSSTLINERELDNPFYYKSPNNTWEYIVNYQGTHEYSYYQFTDTWNYVSKNLSDSQMSKAFQCSYFDCLWYNNTVTTAKITEIQIEYMDGSSITLKDEDLNYIMW